MGTTRQEQKRQERKEKRSQEKKKRVRLSESVPKNTNFYQVLGVERDATHEEIRAAYKRVIRQTHPDVNPSPEATDQFIAAQEAFRWLSDPQQREVYDGLGDKFGQDAIYDYTDEPILGQLDKILEIRELQSAAQMCNNFRKDITWRQTVKIDTTVRDVRKRFRKYGAERIMWMKNRICRELRQVLQYPQLIRRLHPFERLSVELSLAHHMHSKGAPFGQLMAAIKDLKRRVHETAAYRAHCSSKAEKGREATFIADECIEDMLNMVTDAEPMVQQFIEAQRVIFKTPRIDLDKPTCVFIGAPNVGKSSLVRSLSTGVPEVNSYMFTTKQLTIGHLWHFIAGTPLLIQGQIVDSPGMRFPPGKGDPNLMDLLTLGSMEHLPSGVVFVFDPYPVTHGLLSVDKQIELREALREKFPKRPWLDVITKIDVEEGDEALEKLAGLYPDAVLVSALEGTGLDMLNMEVRRLLEEMTKVVRQLQRTKLRQLRVGANPNEHISKEALVLR